MNLAVLGNPVLHSLSPKIHRQGLKQLNLIGNSVRIQAATIGEGVEICRSLNITASNVTAPLKNGAKNIATCVSEAGETIGACNLLHFEGDDISAYNTDYLAVYELIKDLSNDSPITGAIILGAGGASNAVAKALKDCEIPFKIWARKKEAADEICRAFGGEYAPLSEISDAKLVINCVSDLSWMPETPLHKGQTLLDCHYSKESSIAAMAKKNGVTVIDGSRWFLLQAEKTFSLLFPRITPPALSIPEKENFGSPHIVLVGLMGSGKSTLGKNIGEVFGLQVIDTDGELTRQEGLTIPEIVEKHGWEYFRKKEEELNLRYLDTDSPTVFSLGGGAVLSEKVRKKIKERALCLWTHSPIESLVERTKQDLARPLLKGLDPEETFAKLLKERAPLYSEVCDLLIPTHRREINQLTEDIKNDLNRAWKS